LDICAVRPALFPNSLQWEQQAEEWQAEHDLSIGDLIEKYVLKAKTIAKGKIIAKANIN
jgi:hypothetical protein